MHPAYSVILFTTASGAGYGLLIWMALAGALRGAPSDWGFGLVGLGLALLLITGGLLSSTAHLGRPERAWRAFSQWRSSWLSREGVLAVATYIPAGVLAIAWVFFEQTQGSVVFAAVITAVLALATVYSTGMIYASLPTVRAWHKPLTVPVYLALSIASGGLLFVFVLSLFRELPTWAIVFPLLALATAFVTKWSYWRTIDDDLPALTSGDATGLGHLGTVRQLEPPHTQENYVMREMGYSVARKYAEKLRRLAATLLFAVPTVCLTLLLVSRGSGVAPLVSLVAVAAMAGGVLIERWLFFAEAEHTVMLYYGAEAA